MGVSSKKMCMLTGPEARWIARKTNLTGASLSIPGTHTCMSSTRYVIHILLNEPTRQKPRFTSLYSLPIAI